jgi:site-specific recombinase XerD
MVRNTLKGLSRGSGDQDQATPLRWAQIQAIAQITEQQPAGLRTRALLSVAHNTLARRQELVGIRVEDVRRHDDGTGLIGLRPTKHRPECCRFS